MTKYLIVTAGGAGKRMGSDIPKQFIDLAGKPIILRTIERFLEYDNQLKIILVLPENHFDSWNTICKKHSFKADIQLVIGGDERFYSVKNGLKEATEHSLIAIHDAVRPLVSLQTIERCFDMAQKEGAAIPVIIPPESIREEDIHGQSRPLNRDNIRLVQTPQIFRSDILLRAYNSGYSPHFTDDATVVESLGNEISLVEGNTENIKITTPLDLKIAEVLIREKMD